MNANGETDPDYSPGYARGQRDGEAQARLHPYDGPVQYWTGDTPGQTRHHNSTASECWELPVQLDEVAQPVTAANSPFASGYNVGYRRAFRIGSVPS